LIFNNRNLEQCKWSKCDKGVYRGYHTPVEWDTHRQYVKVDLPPPIYPVQFEEEIVVEDRRDYHAPAQPQNPHYMVNTQPVIGSRKWQWLAIGTMIAVWGTVIYAVVSIL
jgi:hypothetical protein